MLVTLHAKVTSRGVQRHEAVREEARSPRRARGWPAPGRHRGGAGSERTQGAGPAPSGRPRGPPSCGATQGQTVTPVTPERAQLDRLPLNKAVAPKVPSPGPAATTVPTAGPGGSRPPCASRTAPPLVGCLGREQPTAPRAAGGRHARPPSTRPAARQALARGSPRPRAAPAPGPPPAGLGLGEGGQSQRTNKPTPQARTSAQWTAVRFNVPAAQHWASVPLSSSSRLPSMAASLHFPSTDTERSPFFTSRQTWWPWMERLYMEAQESTLSTTEKWW